MHVDANKNYMRAFALIAFHSWQQVKWIPRQDNNGSSLYSNEPLGFWCCFCEKSVEACSTVFALTFVIVRLQLNYVFD